jgi:hypothetical protein
MSKSVTSQPLKSSVAVTGVKSEWRVPQAAVLGGAQEFGEIRGGVVIKLPGGLAGVENSGRFPRGVQIEHGALFGGEGLLARLSQMRDGGTVQTFVRR